MVPRKRTDLNKVIIKLYKQDNSVRHIHRLIEGAISRPIIAKRLKEAGYDLNEGMRKTTKWQMEQFQKEVIENSKKIKIMNGKKIGMSG